jgi:hypothetical protein
VDSPAVVTPDLERGRTVVKRLDEALVPVHSAFWAYFNDAAEWRLVIGTPLVEQRGPRAAYEAVEKALTGTSDIPLRYIVVMGMDDPLRKQMVAAIKTDRRSTTPMTASGNFGESLSDAIYVYRST